MTFATLRRVLMLGVHLLDTADAYTWGLHRESGAFRAACAAQLVAAAMDRRSSPAQMRRRNLVTWTGREKRQPR